MKYDIWEEQEFDDMDGHDFEHFCAEVLRQNEFKNVRVTRGSGDQGVDILANKDGKSYAIQCKHYASRVGNKPVQEVFAGKVFYKCDIAAVITNSTFTQGAIDLANATDVILWDRNQLMYMLGRCDKPINLQRVNKGIDAFFKFILYVAIPFGGLFFFILCLLASA